MNTPTVNPELNAAFRKALNSHGYPFQQAVIRESLRLFDSEKSQWLFRAAEVPVATDKRDTKIDLVLEALNYWRGDRLANKPPTSFSPPFFIIGECKRVDPAVSNWCFARSPHVANSPHTHSIIVEYFHKELPNTDDDSPFGMSAPNVLDRGFRSIGMILGLDSPCYHIGLVVKSGEPGNGTGSGRDTIEDAATQVLAGLNGFVEYLSHAETHDSAILIPVVFTTAKLFTTKVDISTASLDKGQLSGDSLDAVEVPFVQYQYHVSTSLKHRVWLPFDPPDLTSALLMESVRTVLIVNAARLGEFFGAYSKDLSFFQDNLIPIT